MKLLFDQNISIRIISKISSNFPEAHQVLQLGIENYSDTDILEFVKSNGYSIITFDSDFYDSSNLKEFPPKIIWLRFSNKKTDFIANIINSKNDLIKDFISSREYFETTCLEIN